MTENHLEILHSQKQPPATKQIELEAANADLTGRKTQMSLLDNLKQNFLALRGTGAD